MEIRLSIQSKADGNLREIKRDIGEGLAVGRGAEEGILLDGPDLSREHLIISTDGKYIYVTDISNNGTWLNGTRLRRSLRTRVRTEDTIEVPGYVINIEPVAKPDETNDGAEVALVPSPPSALEPVPSSLPAESPRGGPLAVLDPVFQFVGSFTFVEKSFVGIGLCGLLLIYSYLS
jgi:pSer/pThr/pTyr-binding forkhead associated (FHA) protein